MEDCVNGGGCESCKLYSVEKPPCNKYALDLIDRLQAENERLNNRKNVYDFAEYRKNEIKAKAITEFAERLKNEYSDFDEEMEVILPENIFNAINSLLKELVGESGG